MVNAMKNILFGTIFFFVIAITMVQSQFIICEPVENPEGYTIYECGVRRFGDQLLFNDIQRSNWTTGINNELSVQYNNINITWFRAEVSSNYDYFRHIEDFENQGFRVYARSSNSTIPFELNITVYGWPQNNTEVGYGCISQQNDFDEMNFITYHNPKYQ